MLPAKIPLAPAKVPQAPAKDPLAPAKVPLAPAKDPLAPANVSPNSYNGNLVIVNLFSECNTDPGPWKTIYSEEIFEESGRLQAGKQSLPLNLNFVDKQEEEKFKTHVFQMIPFTYNRCKMKIPDLSQANCLLYIWMVL